MKLKYYVVFAAIFMLIVGVYVYDLESASYTYHCPLVKCLSHCLWHCG